MHRCSSKIAVIAGSAALLALAAPALAASPYYVKIADIPGETKPSEFVGVKSLRKMQDPAPDVPARQAPQRSVKADRAPGTAPASLLLPAVQRMHQMVVPIPAWERCLAGQRVPNVQVREGETGRVGMIVDARVGECQAEHISLNYTKINW